MAWPLETSVHKHREEVPANPGHLPMGQTEPSLMLTAALLPRNADVVATLPRQIVVGYVIVLVGLTYALGGLGARIGPLLGALGLGGLVLALALQGPVENFFGGLILQSRRPFTVGDTVVLGDQTGVVKDVDSRAVVLVEALGRVARIRNDPPPLAILREFAESSINFEVLYWHASDVPSELAATHDVVLAIHEALAVAGITIAFSQMVVWSGGDPEDAPYDGSVSEVYTHHPGVAGADHGDGDDSSGGWRRWRRG
ncbi:MAG: mechanosensitive ion channel [Acidimicrobiales bacterium]|nr:MAG: mechanosensitive ion channel [Acidimicrobiales bacterium]